MKGLGFFLASKDCQEEPGRLAERIAGCGAKWAAVWLEAPDGRTLPFERAEALCASLWAYGVTPWVWTFPAAGEALGAAERVGRALSLPNVRGVILDVEVEHKGRPGDAKALVDATLDAMTERHEIAVTSYPFGHPTMPWPQLAAGIGMPQLYRTAATPTLIERGLREWGERHDVIVPVCASYLGDAGRMLGDLRRVCMPESGIRVPGVGIWAWGSTDGSERAVLRDTVAGWF